MTPAAARAPFARATAWPSSRRRARFRRDEFARGRRRAARARVRAGLRRRRLRSRRLRGGTRRTRARARCATRAGRPVDCRHRRRARRLRQREGAAVARRPHASRAAGKPIVGYSDLTSLLTFCTVHCGLVAFHGPMLAGASVARARPGTTATRCCGRCADAEPLGALRARRARDAARRRRRRACCSAGTLTQLAASLGTPFAFDPPAGCVLLHRRRERAARTGSIAC